MKQLRKISRHSVLFSVSALAASNVLLQVLGFIYRIFLSRMTGAEGMGVYSLVMPFYSVITSISLTGITVAVSRISAEKYSARDFASAGRCVLLSRRIFIFAVCIIAAFTLLFSDTVSLSLLGDARCKKALPLTIICLLFTGFENILKNYFYGTARIVPQITSELAEQIIRIAAVAALLLAFRPADAGDAAALIFAGMIISELFSSGILTLFYTPEKRQRTKKSPHMLRKIISVALPVSASATLNNLLSSANAVLIPRRLIASGISAVAATESFGIMFGMTMPLLSFPIAFIAAITSIMIPKLAEGIARGDLPDVRRKAGKAIHTTSLLAMPCMALLAPLGAQASKLIFAHSSAGEFMLPLCIATLFSYYQITAVALLNGIGMQRRAAIYIVIGGAIQLIFTWSVGLPHIGMRGFVAGYLINGALTSLLCFSCLVKKLKMQPRIKNWFLFPALAATLAGLITDITFKALIRNGAAEVFSLIAAALFGGAIYCLSLSALGTSLPKYLRTLIPKEQG